MLRSANERVRRAMAELMGHLAERGTQAALPRVLEVLERLERAAYSAGYEDAETAIEDRRNEGAEAAYEARLREETTRG